MRPRRARVGSGCAWLLLLVELGVELAREVRDAALLLAYVPASFALVGGHVLLGSAASDVELTRLRVHAHLLRADHFQLGRRGEELVALVVVSAAAATAAATARLAFLDLLLDHLDQLLEGPLDV